MTSISFKRHLIYSSLSLYIIQTGSFGTFGNFLIAISIPMYSIAIFQKGGWLYKTLIDNLKKRLFLIDRHLSFHFFRQRALSSIFSIITYQKLLLIIRTAYVRKQYLNYIGSKSLNFRSRAVRVSQSRYELFANWCEENFQYDKLKY